VPDYPFTPGSPLSSDVLNNYVMKQVIITCLSSARPSAPQQGQMIYQTDTDSFYYYNGSAWQTLSDWVSYVPTLTAATTNPTLGVGGTASGIYFRHGRSVHMLGCITFGSSGVNAGSGNYSIALPPGMTFPTMGTYTRAGTLVVANAASGIFNGYLNAGNGATSMSLTVFNTASSRQTVSHSAPGAWAANDSINFDVTFPIA
jgi:hypothetical protein